VPIKAQLNDHSLNQLATLPLLTGIRSAPALTCPPAATAGAAAAPATAGATAAAAAQAVPSAKKGVKKFENGFEIHSTKMGDPHGKLAKSGKKVWVKYVGKLMSGKVFDKTDKKPFQFRLGEETE
jgi:FKBP-type peptidyl-prolyl cis-trans isomerase